MENELISDSEVQKALDYLRDNAKNVGKAKGQRYQLEEGRKVIKARLMRTHADLAVNAQEREAYADEEYEEYLKGVAEAIENDEAARWFMKAAEAKIECWRTYNANLRSMKI
jgi:rubrerythrin